MTSVQLELYRHSAWANLQLVDLLRTLPEATLDATTPGTYGSIRATLVHLVNNDAFYYAGIVGEPPPPPLESTASLERIAERLRAGGPRWEQLQADPALPDKELTNPRGSSRAVAPLAQSIHHATVHRTHILSVLGARGLSVPELDMWEYGAAAGYVRAPASD